MIECNVFCDINDQFSSTVSCSVSHSSVPSSFVDGKIGQKIEISDKQANAKAMFIDVDNDEKVQVGTQVNTNIDNENIQRGNEVTSNVNINVSKED